MDRHERDVRRPVKYWVIRLGKGSFYHCVDGGWGLLDFTEVKKYFDAKQADRALKNLQKNYPAANLQGV